MGFKLPGKSIQAGTSAHSSALKMVAEQKAASALKKTYKEAYEEKSDKGEATRKKYKTQAEFETAAEKWWASEAGQKRAKTDPKFAHRIKKDTTKSGGKDTKKKVIERLDMKEEIKKKEVGDGKKVNTTNIPSTKKDVKDVRKSGKQSVKDAKKQKRIDILKAKKDVADVKGKTRRSERLARKIERKETGKTKREQRQERRKAKVANKEARSKAVTAQAKEDAAKARSTAGTHEAQHGKIKNKKKKEIGFSKEQIKDFDKKSKDPNYTWGKKKKKTNIKGSLTQDYKKPTTKITGSLMS